MVQGTSLLLEELAQLLNWYFKLKTKPAFASLVSKQR